GVRPIVCEDARDLDDMIAKARHYAVRAGLATSGQALVITAGLPFGTPGATNALRIAYVTDRDVDAANE
ncbi:MAG: pyruvate kinase alpha/beta domain-containing protein, partial [Pseudomonadota bacterium]